MGAKHKKKTLSRKLDSFNQTVAKTGLSWIVWLRSVLDLKKFKRTPCQYESLPFSASKNVVTWFLHV